MRSFDLNGSWQFKAERIPRGLQTTANGLRRWMSATVPGTVHTDLIARKRIPDPFFRTNELGVRWVEEVDWTYRRTFVLTDEFLRVDAVRLIAEGLDTFAAITVNGQPLGTTANMFVAHEFDAKPSVHAGRNTLDIRFESPVLRAKALEQEHGRLQVGHEVHRVYARKAQYSFGWDWGPALATSGIWRPIRLEAYTAGRLLDPFVQVLHVNSKEANLRLAVGVERFAEAELAVNVEIRGFGTEILRTFSVGDGPVSMDFMLPDPRIWWPNGYGDQPMYEAVLTLFASGEAVHVLYVPFGVRTVRLLQEADSEGQSFVVEVNGVKVFCKGVDWIPADSFLPRVRGGVYERLLTLSRDASMNMIRVWGGGIYEQEEFYTLCDRFGLMVWQDFMYACGEYPDDPGFLEAARREAGQVVRRLRNHPSIVLWCGNNECEWLFCQDNPGKGPDDMRGAAIFRDVLPATAHEHDGTRPYWRSTPFGPGFPNAQTHGNHHQWEVWSHWKDYRQYEQNRARFVSEFGFQAPADPRTLARVLLPADRTPQSPVMEHHNKQQEGTERLYRFQAAHYRVADEWQDFIFRSQLVQAEALKYAVEHWRRRKFATAGSLIWQLNDCWPVSSWSLIDSDLRPKAAYYYARRFYAPLLVSMVRSGEGVEVWGTNDLLQGVQALLGVTVLSFRGRVLWKRRLRVDLPANTSCALALVPGKVIDGVPPGEAYILAELVDGTRKVSENRFFFQEPKHLKLTRPRINFRLKKEKPGVYRAVLQAPALVLGARLVCSSDEVALDDNVVDLDPGRPRTITLTCILPSAGVRRLVSVTSYSSETR